ADRLISAAEAILANREVVVPCMAGEVAEIVKKTSKVHRLKTSLKLQDLNPKRDFVDWGSDDFTSLAGMPGFSQFAPLTRIGPDAQAISIADYNGDGRPDLCLVGAQKIALMRNDGTAFTPEMLPAAISGCRSAVWADYNGDGRPDLLLATATG